MSHTSFFALGNSNAISSIDLSNAYNGVSGYNVLAVGILLFVSNWAGPIYWSTSAAVLFSLPSIEEEEARLDAQSAAEKAKGSRQWIDNERELLRKQALSSSSVPSGRRDAEDEGTWSDHIATMTVFISAALLAVMVACTLLRTHLFIWTVFSPKYLFAMAWGVAWHLIVNVCFAGGLWYLR